jgi:hypothetical protein
MSIDEIKKGLVSLSEAEQREVTAFLFHLRHIHDSEYQNAVSNRLADVDKGNWLTPEDFERQLDQK